MIFSIGDTVIVKEWDDLVSEFGTDSDGDIDVGPSYFFRSMKCMYGKIGTVDSFDEDDETYCVTFDPCENDYPDAWVPEAALRLYVEPVRIQEIAFSFDDMLKCCD